jgi:hypothetical protein
MEVDKCDISVDLGGGCAVYRSDGPSVHAATEDGPSAPATADSVPADSARGVHQRTASPADGGGEEYESDDGEYYVPGVKPKSKGPKKARIAFAVASGGDAVSSPEDEDEDDDETGAEASDDYTDEDPTGGGDDDGDDDDAYEDEGADADDDNDARAARRATKVEAAAAVRAEKAAHRRQLGLREKPAEVSSSLRANGGTCRVSTARFHRAI